MKIAEREKYLQTLEKKFDKNKVNSNSINITIKDERTIFSSFSNGKPLISNEFSEYIDDQITSLNLNEGFNINIFSENINEEKKKVYKEAIINFYENKILTYQRNSKKMSIKSLIFMFIGISILSLSLFLDRKNTNTLSIEIYDIVAWVFVWEATYIFFIQKPIITHKKIKAIEIANSKITFNK